MILNTKPISGLSEQGKKLVDELAIEEKQLQKKTEESKKFVVNNENPPESVIDKPLKKKPKEYKMTEEEKEVNRKILKNMNRKQNFVKNPRFRNNGKFMLYSNAMFSSILNNENPFVVEPLVVTFREYQLNCIYQIDLKLTNRKQILTSFKYIPPETQKFSIKKIIYPKKDTGLIAPGMHAKIEVLFNATSLDNFEDEISIITETFAFKIPLRAIRESPALSLDNPMTTGKCLLGDQTSMVFRCKNNGGDAHFKFYVKEDIMNTSNLQGSSVSAYNPHNNSQLKLDQNELMKINSNNPQNHFAGNTTQLQNSLSSSNQNMNELNNTSNIMNTLNTSSGNNNFQGGTINYNNNSGNFNSTNNQDNEVLNVGPFSIFPQEFYLYKGMSVEIYVNFSPSMEGIIEKELNICCDSKHNLNQKIVGEGICVDFKIISLDGIPVNETIEKLENIFFDDAFTSTETTRILRLKNMSSVNLHYHWSIYNSFEKISFATEEEEDYFSIQPLNGIFEPFEEINFIISFKPKNSKNYEQKLDFVIEDIPFQSIKGHDIRLHKFKSDSRSNNASNTSKSKDSTLNSKNINKSSFTKGEPFMIVMNSPYPSYPFFSFNLKGKGKQTFLDIDSKIIDLGVVYINEHISNTFYLSNSKSGFVKFCIPKIMQSINGKDLFDTNSIANINNYFNWSEPGSTITDHLKNDCIFKSKIISNLSNKENFKYLNKNIYTPLSESPSMNRTINEETDNYNKNNLNNMLPNDINNNFLMNNDNKNSNIGSDRNIISPTYKNSVKTINSNFSKYSPNTVNNKQFNFTKSFNEKMSYQDKGNNSIISNPIKYVKLFIKKNYLNGYEDDIENSNVRNNFTSQSRKWTNKVKNDKIKNIKTNKELHNTNLDNVSFINHQQNSTVYNPDIKESKFNIDPNNTVTNKIIKRERSHDTSKKNNYNPLTTIMKIKTKRKMFENNQINSDVSNENSKTNLSKETSRLNPKINRNEKIIAKDKSDTSLRKDSAKKSFTRNKLLKTLDGSNNTIFNSKTNMNLNNNLLIEENLAKNSKERVLSSQKNRNRNTDTRSKYIHSTRNIKSSNDITNENLSDSMLTDFELEENVDMILKKDQKIKVNVLFNPKKLGNYKSSIIVSPYDGVPFSVDFFAKVIGPKVEVNTPCINFGLFGVNEIRNEKIILKNTSRTTAIFLIKETRYKTINFDNYMNNDYVLEREGFINEIKDRRKILNIDDFNNIGMLEMDQNVRDNYEIKFSQISGKIDEGQEIEINIGFISAYPTYKFDQIEIMIMHSESLFVNFHADCQQPLAYLDKNYIVPKNIFVNVPISFEHNTIKIINPSNLPINFEWENVKIQEEKYIEFYPQSGIVNPNSSIEIYFKMLYYSIKTIDDIFLCYIKELDVPIGINVRGSVTGLEISYELTDESLNFFNHSKFDATTIHSSSLASGSLMKRKSTFDRRLTHFLHESNVNNSINKNLSILDFKNLKVNKSSSIHFVLKNLSGISTYFNFESKNYSPGVEKDIRYNMNKVSTTKTQSDMRNTKESNFRDSHIQSSQNNSYLGLTKNAFGLKKNFLKTNMQKHVIGHQLLDDAHEQLNFTSQRGSEFTKMRQLEKDAVLFLSSKKGVAVIVEPKEGKLDPYSEIMVNVTIYNECVGDYEDELISRVKGLPERRFPINLRIRGNPLQLPLFQPGINYNESPPILNMGYITANINEIDKSFKVINTGTNLINLDWKIFDYEDIENPKQDIFKIKITCNKKKEEYSLLFNAVLPEPDPTRNTFNITPSDILIQPKGTQDFTVKFKTDKIGLQSCLLVAYPKFIDDEKTSKVKLSELALRVNGVGVKPNLVVDKRIDFEGKYRYRFYIHSFGTSPKPKCSIILINKEKINFIVRLNLDGPFKFVNFEPDESVINSEGKLFNIIPNSNLKVVIKALVPDPLSLDKWPITLVNEKQGKLSVTYENGEISEYYLTSVFKRPRLTMSTTGNDSVEGPNYIDFGKVNCESFKKSCIFLKNITDVETDWQINYIKHIPKEEYGYGTTTIGEKEDMQMTDDPDMFMFSITNGKIEGPSLALNNIPLGPGLPQVKNENTKKFMPLKIEIMFKPKKNIFYKCRYKIVSSTGNSIDFLLKGWGSYLEEMIEN